MYADVSVAVPAPRPQARPRAALASAAAATPMRAPATHGGRLVEVAREALIHAEGDPMDYWYEVVEGAVRLGKLTPDGRRQLVDILLPGEVFGFDGWGVHATSAEAAGENGAVVLRRCRRRLEALADSDIEVARRVRQFNARHLARAHERLLLLGRRTATERVALFLLEMEARLASPDGVLDLPMVCTDIGDYLGLTMETVSRTIGMFRRQHIIDLPTCHRIVIRDRRALLAAAGQGHETTSVNALCPPRLAFLPAAA